MAGRSLFRRLLGNRTDALGPDDGVTAPNPTGPVPVPYPHTTTDVDGPVAVAKSDGVVDQPDGTSRTVVADAEPTAFDEADAVFGQRTEGPVAEVVAPTEQTSVGDAEVGPRTGDVEANGIMSPGSVVDEPDEELEPLVSDDGPVDNGVVDNGVVDGGGDKLDELTETYSAQPLDIDDQVDDQDGGPELRVDATEGRGTASPNNLIDDEPDDDLDDDLVLVDLSGGSIAEQLTATAGFSSDAAELGLTGDHDDLDDLDVD